jgi:phage shock protein A
MNDQRLQEISNAYSDAEKIRLILQYLNEVTAELTDLKAMVSSLITVNQEIREVIVNNADLVQQTNQLLEQQGSLIQTLQNHLSTHDDHLAAHDQHLETHGKHLKTLEDRL